MRKTMNKLFSILLVLSFLVVPCSQAESVSKIRIKVEVVSDEVIAGDIQDYITKALSRIDDVEIVEAKPGVYVHIMVRRLVTNRGRRLGYVMASATSEVLDMLVENNFPFTLTDYTGLWLETGPDLYSLCEQCVMAVDSGVLTRFREEDQQL